MQKHVVIIENNKPLLSEMGNMLKDAGYKVTMLEIFVSIEHLIGYNASCFIINEHMPHISGHILRIILKSTPQTKKIPVILSSESDNLEFIVALCEADASLKKPFTREQLLRAVADIDP